MFGAGTAQWAWGLDGHHDLVTGVDRKLGDNCYSLRVGVDLMRPAGDRTIQQATTNLFADMGVVPTTPVKGIVITGASSDIQGPIVHEGAFLDHSTTMGSSTVDSRRDLVIRGTAVDVRPSHFRRQGEDRGGGGEKGGEGGEGSEGGNRGGAEGAEEAVDAGDAVGVVAAVEVRMNAADRWHPADVILLTGAWSFLPPPDSTLAAQIRVVADAAARGERGAVLTMGSRGLPSVMVRAVDDSGNMGDVFDVGQGRTRDGREIDTLLLE